MKKSLFETIIEIVQAVAIALSPILIGFFTGIIDYLNFPNFQGLILACVIQFIAIIIGILWAISIWKKQGTNHFMSRVMASPDLDKTDKETVE